MSERADLPPTPALRTRLICRTDRDLARCLRRELEARCSLQSVLYEKRAQARPVVIAYDSSELIKALQRRGSPSPFPGDGVWAEVWTLQMQRTPYEIMVRDDGDADAQLDHLCSALGHARDERTIKPPRGWLRYGMP